MRFLLKALGWASILFAFAGIAVEIDNARTGKDDNLSAGIAVVLIFGGGGALLVRKARRMKRTNLSGTADAPSIEQRVLTSARVHHGRLTAVSAAADGSVTLEEARVELERLAKVNACLMEISSEGLVVFRFPEFESSDPRLSP